ncbi:MAG TPA: HigA family addiction module antitoxin, partial [Thermodesulfobacteriota bacterium]|nr:HigA family addiction module antitoxin [Thermodesulfobacteriota bacterium]
EGLSQHKLAMLLKIPFVRINEICNRKRSITPDTAIRLGAFFQQSPQYWMNLQTQYDLEIVERRLGKEIEEIRKTAANY